MIRLVNITLNIIAGALIVKKTSNIFVRIFKGTWSAVNSTRKIVVNLIFLVIVVALLSTLFTSDAPKIAEKTALVINPNGRLVEQLTANSVKRIIDDIRGVSTPETLLKDVVDAINAAKEDDRIQVLVLNLSSFGGAQLTKLQDVAKAINNFKSSGKKVVAMADYFAQDSYHIASNADEIIMHKMGNVTLEGYGRYKRFYKDGIDKLGLDVNVFKVGTYKSAVEPYVRNDMSDFAKEANKEWMGDLWQIYLDDVAAARAIKSERVDEYAQQISSLISQANGDSAKAALDFGLIDQALTRVEMQTYLIGLVGEDKKTHSYNKVAMDGYLKTIKADRFGRKAKGDKVAVIVARGTILDGSQPAGTIGGDSTAKLIRQARHDDAVKAIVFRVDSGGGSAFASEIIRVELQKARAEGKPVIASMGSVAASGGYWVSTSADQIWAHPGTITGSIGIFGILPTYQRPLEKHLGIKVDGISTAPLAGVRLDRELPAEVGNIIQALIEHGYQEFLQRVADSRGMTTEEVNEYAQGRVWSGEDAYKLGLVDNLGDLNGAVEAAASLAKIDGKYTVSYVEKEQSFSEKLMSQLAQKALVSINQNASETSKLEVLFGQIKKEVMAFNALNDPNHVYALSNIKTD